MAFQRQLVRTSTPCYGGFTLPQSSSHGLRVHSRQLIAQLALAFTVASLQG